MPIYIASFDREYTPRKIWQWSYTQRIKQKIIQTSQQYVGLCYLCLPLRPGSIHRGDEPLLLNNGWKWNTQLAYFLRVNIGHTYYLAREAINLESPDTCS